tara:strand:+ start:509 stop:1186 length:678 start_codon:yes stop_codon:yes gene_type:complete
MFLITGASGGIGYELFKKLSKNNDVIGISHTKKLEEHERGLFINIDLTNHEEINQMIKENKELMKKLTIIQLAVYSHDGLIANYPIEEIRKTFELNLFSNIVLLKSLLPIMIEQKWGRIIHFSSIIGNEGANGAGIYSSSKSALIGYSKTLAKEYGRFGITSNIVELGYFDNGLIKNFKEEKIKAIISQTPVKRLGKIQDIISAINFIEKSNFYNGEVLKLNGGI